MENTNDEYGFKRSFYYEVVKAIEGNKVTIVLGPRKCGKTVCLKQLSQTVSAASYYDIKSMNKDEALDLIDDVVRSIQNNEYRIYLIDEVTSWDSPEDAIGKIANAYADYKRSQTRVVFTGSQSVALEAWASRHFACNARFIYADFLSYPEWLAYKKINEVSERTYNQYVLGIREFYSDFVSLDAYLKGCLEETMLSNYKTRDIIFNNNCDALSERILKNVLYATLVSQSDRPALSSFFDKNYLLRIIRNSLKEAYDAAGSETVFKRIDDIFSERITGYSSTDFETLKQSYIFLHKCGLVTLTYVSDETQNFEAIVNVPEDLCKWDSNAIKNKNELFSRVNICIKYPMFYAEILKEVLSEYFPSAIKGDILGGIVECQVRGLLSQHNCYEYHRVRGIEEYTENGEPITRTEEHEVDYVNYAKSEAVEISVRNKIASELHFDDLPTSFTKILLTKDQNYTQKDGLIRVPYYDYIYKHSVGKELVNQIGSNIQHKSKPASSSQQQRKTGKVSKLMNDFAETVEQITDKREGITSSCCESSSEVQIKIDSGTCQITFDFIKGKIDVFNDKNPISCTELKRINKDLWDVGNATKKALKSFVEGKDTPFKALFEGSEH